VAILVRENIRIIIKMTRILVYVVEGDDDSAEPVLREATILSTDEYGVHTIQYKNETETYQITNDSIDEYLSDSDYVPSSSESETESDSEENVDEE
jgi:hypothetical protein